VITGIVVSTTVISNEAKSKSPSASVALQATVVSPTGNVSPDVASQNGVIGPSTISNAETLNVTAAPDPLLLPL